MDINKIFDGDIDKIADKILNQVVNTREEAKAIRQQKINENVQYIIEAFKKIESDINSRYDFITNSLEERILSIKDSRDGINGSNKDKK